VDSLITANVRQRPVRALVSAAGVALGVCLVMLFTGLARGLSNDLQRRSANLKAEIIFTKGGSSDPLTAAANVDVGYAADLMKVEGVQMALPALRNMSQGGQGFGLEQVEGVDWRPFAEMNGNQLVQGRAPEGLREVVVDETKARNNKLTVGSTINLFGDLPYTVTGIYTPEAGPRVKMSLAAMQDILEAKNKSTWIYVKVKDPAPAEEVARRINDAFPGNKIQMTRDVFTNVEKSIPYLSVFLRALVVLAAIVSALVVMLAMYTTITERTREIGVLKALGASRPYIVGVIEKEAVLISIIGVIAGFVIAFGAAFLIESSSGLIFEYSWTWALTALLIGMGGGALGALYPAVRAANLDPVSALSYE
jgi:putative ABC transport system permease protein